MARPDQWSPFRGDAPLPPDDSSDLARFIPGTSIMRPAALPPEDDDWRNDPFLRRVCRVPTDTGTETVTLYTIGALARALDKSPVTIRKWIRAGVLPDSGMRTQRVLKTLGDAGRRLWTAEQIEVIARVAREEAVVGDKRVRNFSESNFAGRLRTIWWQNNW